MSDGAILFCPRRKCRACTKRAKRGTDLVKAQPEKACARRSRYFRHKGTRVAGSTRSSLPLARTSKVCASTVMTGSASLCGMSFLPSLRTLVIGSIGFCTSSLRCKGLSRASWLTKVADNAFFARPSAPHIGRCTIGSLMKMLPLPSPIADQVGCVAAAGAFRVIHVHAAIADHCERVLAEAELVDGVGIDVHCEIVTVGRDQRAVENGRRSTEVLVDLHAEGATGDRFLHCADVHAAAPEEAEVQRELVGGADQLPEHVRS